MKSQKRWGIDVAEYTPIKTVIQTFEILDILSQHQKKWESVRWRD